MLSCVECSKPKTRSMNLRLLFYFLNCVEGVCVSVRERVCADRKCEHRCIGTFVKFHADRTIPALAIFPLLTLPHPFVA